MSRALIIKGISRLELACTVYDKTNPLALLGRGFALVRGVDGKIISSAQQARDALKLDLSFADGHVIAVVEDH